MTLSAQEQYMLELINRARLDPLAEAARLSIGLNAGLAPGMVDPTDAIETQHDGLFISAGHRVNI